MSQTPRSVFTAIAIFHAMGLIAFVAFVACTGDDNVSPVSTEPPIDGAAGTDTPPGTNDDGTSPSDGPALPPDANAPKDGTIASLAVGGRHACVLRRDGRVSCWGANDHSQLGVVGVAKNGPTEVAFPPNTSPPIVPVQIAAGEWFTCITDDQLRVWCWGDNSLDEIGNPQAPSAETPLPTQVVLAGGVGLLTRKDLPGVFASSQSATACAITPDSSLFCWGWNRSKQLGSDDVVEKTAVPTIVNNVPAPILAAAGGAQHTCAIEQSQGTPRVVCWGRDLEKKLDDINATNSATPTFPFLEAEPRMVRSGATHSCAIDAMGHLACWGSNSAGQLGPTTITGCGGSGCPGITPPYADTDFVNDKIVDLALGYRFTCALIDTGSIYCMGLNSHTQLSGIITPDETDHATRVKVRTIDDATAIGVGDRFGCALRKTGGPKNGPAAWCWGDNTDAQLGTDDAGTRAVIEDASAVTSYEPMRVPIPD